VQRGVARADSRVAIDDEGLDELVGLARRVALLDALLRGGGARPLALHDGAEGAFDPLPAVVAIHAPVAPADGADAARTAAELALHGAHVARCGAGLHVAAVEEGVHNGGYARGPGDVDERLEVHE
jgi:hypothetical protein